MSRRRAEPARRSIAVLAGAALAVLALVAGAGVLTFAWLRQGPWQPASTVTAQAPVDVAGGVATVPAGLVARGSSVAVTATGTGTVFVGVARAGDAAAWLADHRVATAVSALGGHLTLHSAGTATGALTPADSDVWVASTGGRGSAAVEWSRHAGDWQVVATGASAVQVTWQRDTAPTGQPSIIGGGLALVAVALVAAGATVGALRRRRPARTGGAALVGIEAEDDDDPDAGRARPLALLTMTAALAGAALVLAGCGPPPRDRIVASSAPVTAAAAPVVLAAQGQAVCDAVDAAWTAGARLTAKNAAKHGFGPRVAGAAAARLLAQVRLHAARPKAALPTGVFTRQRLVVSRTAAWPRWIAEVGTVTGESTPQVRVLLSTSPRTPYALVAVASLLPGAALPEVTPADRGAPLLAADTAGLVLTPAATVTAYAEVLTKGVHAGREDLFATDAYRAQLSDKLATDKAAFRKIGTVGARHVVDARTTPVLALRTADGGALVVGVLRETYTVRLNRKTARVGLQGDTAALAGRKTFTHQATERSVETVVLAVPPTGGTTHDSIHLLAAGKMVVEVTGR